MNSTKRYGTDLSSWYNSKRPDDLEIDSTHFDKLIGKMESEGLIESATINLECHYLSDKGKKEVIKLKRKLNFNDYYFLISKFPEMELKEKVETLEAFIITSSGLFLIFELWKIPISSYVKNFNIFLVIISIFLFISLLISYYFGQYFSKILIFWMINIRRDKMWVYKEWLFNNRSKIIYPLPVLFVFGISYVLYIMNIAQWQSIVLALVMIVVSAIILNYKKAVEVLQSVFEKYLN